MRPVDVDALLKAIDEERQYLLARGQAGAEHILVRNFRNLVEDAPSIPLPDFKDGYRQAIIDGQANYSRPRGEWIEQGYLEYKCSVCGRHILLEDHWTNITKDYPFCHCGADMRDDSKEYTDPIIRAIQENSAKYNERPSIDFSRMSCDLGESNEPNCVTCDHFGKCEGCEKREEE